MLNYIIFFIISIIIYNSFNFTNNNTNNTNNNSLIKIKFLKEFYKIKYILEYKNLLDLFIGLLEIQKFNSEAYKNSLLYTEYLLENSKKNLIQKIKISNILKYRKDILNNLSSINLSIPIEYINQINLLNNSIKFIDRELRIIIKRVLIENKKKNKREGINIFTNFDFINIQLEPHNKNKFYNEHFDLN